MKIGDTVKIIRKSDGYPFKLLPWDLGDIGYIVSIRCGIAYLSKSFPGKTMHGAFNIRKDLVKVDNPDVAIKSSNPNVTFKEYKREEAANAYKTSKRSVLRRGDV